MLSTFINVFKIPDLRKKILFTVALLVIYRLGFQIPVPFFDNSRMQTDSEQKGDEESYSHGVFSGFYRISFPPQDPL